MRTLGYGEKIIVIFVPNLIVFFFIWYLISGKLSFSFPSTLAWSGILQLLWCTCSQRWCPKLAGVSYQTACPSLAQRSLDSLESYLPIQRRRHRISCTDYIRASFEDFDIIRDIPSEVSSCRKYELVNIRGNECVNCTAATWYLKGTYPLHIDSYFDIGCEFNGGSTGDTIVAEDNFGFYGTVNPKFRCTSSSDATTHWVLYWREVIFISRRTKHQFMGFYSCTIIYALTIQSCYNNTSNIVFFELCFAGLRYCGVGWFFLRYFGNLNLELRYYGILQTCGFLAFWPV